MFVRVYAKLSNKDTPSKNCDMKNMKRLAINVANSPKTTISPHENQLTNMAARQ